MCRSPQHLRLLGKERQQAKIIFKFLAAIASASSQLCREAIFLFLNKGRSLRLQMPRSDPRDDSQLLLTQSLRAPLRSLILRSNLPLAHKAETESLRRVVQWRFGKII